MTTTKTESIRGCLPLATERLESLDESLRGRQCLPGDYGYEEARASWSPRIDRVAVAIVRATTPEHAATAVNFAREHGLDLSLQGGDHNTAGHDVGREPARAWSGWACLACSAAPSP